jgi:hypothetical protein
MCSPCLVVVCGRGELRIRLVWLLYFKDEHTKQRHEANTGSPLHKNLFSVQSSRKLMVFKDSFLKSLIELVNHEKKI